MLSMTLVYYCVQGGSNYRICYSNHASLSEIETFVRHFSPGQITPCAIPPNSSKQEVRDLLTSFLNTAHIAGDECVEDTVMYDTDITSPASISSMSPVSRKRKLSGSGAGSDNVSDIEVRSGTGFWIKDHSSFLSTKGDIYEAFASRMAIEY